MNKAKVANALCIAGMVLSWATYFTVSKWAVGYTSSAFVAGLVLRTAAFVILTIAIIAKRKFTTLFKTGKVAIVLLVIGLLGYLLDTFANLGWSKSSVSTGTVLLKTDILMTNLATAIIFKEKLFASDWVGTVVMLGGVILVLNIDYTSFAFNWYDLFFIASALCVTINAFVIKGVQKKHNTDSDVIAYYNNFVVMLLFLLSALISGDIKVLSSVELSTKFWSLVVLGGLAQSLIYLFYYRNLKKYPVWQVKLFLLFVPIVSCVIGVIAFDEKIVLLQYIGILLVLLGAVVILLREKIQAKFAREKAIVSNDANVSIDDYKGDLDKQEVKTENNNTMNGIENNNTNNKVKNNDNMTEVEIKDDMNEIEINDD